MTNFYIKNLQRFTHYQRYRSRVVNIGGVPLGGDHPIRIQSMTNTDTMDTRATVAQTIRLVEAGCDYVRITAPSVKEAENLGVIKKELRTAGFDVPLIADIHFVPRAAEVAARLVEKVRVNPGNYADRKRFQEMSYDSSEYEAELERIRERFTPLVRLCREEGTAMRIGANHGSLSDRILSHYGDTPLGMVESAMEFVRICASENYHDLVISMKASNTRVMIQAYRLLIDHMEAEGFNYPLHLGVTEAGDGDDARIKSALGIGSLLKDGFGDTIRVSLTESPEAEVPVAAKLIHSLKSSMGSKALPPLSRLPIDLFEYARRDTIAVGKFGADQVPPVILNVAMTGLDKTILQEAGYRFALNDQTWQPGDQGADVFYLGGNDQIIPNLSPETLCLVDHAAWVARGCPEAQIPLISTSEFSATIRLHPQMNFVMVDPEAPLPEHPQVSSMVWVVEASDLNILQGQRRFIFELMNAGDRQPVILKHTYNNKDREYNLLNAAADMGALFVDGIADGIWLDSAELSMNDQLALAFGILQASRSRMTKTEYIACPSCGRTLFDLEEVTAQIRARTGHLKGLKLGIMGCIVNGPGEMADADFGYVGTGPGKVSLYRGQMVVKPHVPQADAVDALIDLIKDEGYWVDP